jgi:hypothetical protein
VLETLNTLFAALTFAVIAVTAIAAGVQLRHLRSSNQLAALVHVLEDWQKPDLQRWVSFVRNELPDKLGNPAYLESVVPQRNDRTMHPWLHLCDYFEQVGSYFKYELVDPEAFLDTTGNNVIVLYRILEPCIASLRAERGPSVYENFEYLAVRSLLWQRRYPNGRYPKNVPRFDDIA